MKLTIAFVLVLSLPIGVGRAQSQQLNQDTTTTPPQQQGGAGWTQVYSDPSVSWNSISFPSRDTAYAFGTGKMLRSIDGGVTWQHLPYPPAFVGSFYDARNGYVAAGNYVTPADTVYRTTDAGETWTASYVGISHVAAMGVVSKDTAFITDGSESIRGTSDGGKTWALSAPVNAVEITYMTFSDPQHGIAVGRYQQGPGPHSGPGCFTTSNGGVAWVQQNVTTSGTLSCATYLSRDTILVIGGDNNGADELRSYDGGLTWHSLLPPDPQTTVLIAVANKGGHILGVGNVGLVRTSIDGGLTWESGNCGSPSDMYSVAMFDDSTALAGSSGGNIYRTTNGGADWVQTSTPSSLVLASNIYPEPSNGLVQLSFVLPELQHVTVTVSDESGREIAKPVERLLETPGSHVIALDGTKWGIGIYNYRIDTERYHATGKFTIVK